MTDGSVYDEDYFLRGRVSGKSLYSDYRWLPDLTTPMVSAIVAHCGITPTDLVLDFGCARGYAVRAFREMGYDAWGYDISQWAIANADEVAKPYLIVNDSTLLSESFDWIVAKDVLEHIQPVADVITGLMEIATKGVFAVVPLSVADGLLYVVPEYEQDVTHVHRLTLASWGRMFARPGWTVEMSYRVRGVKDNYASHKLGNGFLTARRTVS